MDDELALDDDEYLSHENDSESELSLVEVEIAPNPIIQHCRPASSYSRLENNSTVTSKSSALVDNNHHHHHNLSSKSNKDSSTSADMKNLNGSGNGIKLEKRIRLNYRKQPNNVNSLLNFGTLC